MKKLENFSWKMWHIYALAAVTIFMIGAIWSFFFLKEAAYVSNERAYTYIGRGQRLTNYEKVEGLDTEFPILALSLKNEGDDRYDDHVSVGRKYIVFQDSKLNHYLENEKDSEEYFKIRYYQLGKEKGEGHTIDVLKIVQKLGYKTIEGEMMSTMYSDGKDEYVRVILRDKQSIFINIRTQKASKKQPKETIQYGYKGLNRVLSNPDFITKSYWEDEMNTNVSWPWVYYKKPKNEISNTKDSSLSTSDSSQEKFVDSKLFSLLKKYGFLLVLEEDRTLSTTVSLVLELFPDATHFVWSIDGRYTKDGQNEYIHNIDELEQVVDEEKVEKAYENED